MDNRIQSSETLRYKCAACFRQFNRKDHLVDHMRSSYHSMHEPRCGVCNKHCRSFESLREHLIGPLPKVACNSIFSSRGCDLCLAIFNSPNALMVHTRKCQLPPVSIGLLARLANIGTIDNLKISDVPKVVGLACKMVGTDGSMDVCLIDEHENIIFHTYIKPPIPLTNYRYEGMMSLKQVKTKIENFLSNGEPIWKIRPGGSNNRARIVVGHGLDQELARLQIEYPPTMLRDTAKYPPLVKSNKLSESLKEQTKTYLGYDIHQTGGVQNLYEECVAAMRVYMRLRSQVHHQLREREESHSAGNYGNSINLGSWRQAELERMSPEELLNISRSDYYCWCLDSYIV